MLIFAIELVIIAQPTVQQECIVSPILPNSNTLGYEQMENVQPYSIRPRTATDDPQDRVEMQFEDADLKNILEWVSRIFQVSFLTDDSLNPVGKFPVANKKITFKTHEPLTKKQAWDLFITFLDLWGLALDLSSVPNIYQVRPTKSDDPATISRAPLSSYINTHWSQLPDNDMFIRYVYFVQNTTLASIQAVVNTLKSNVSRLQPFKDLDALILTDKASNIRSLMRIVEALDQQAMPEQMSVLKLKNVNAEDVAKLYDTLTKTEDPKSIAARLFGSKKVPTKTYFPETMQLIPDSRTNSIIILGDRESIQKVEDFIINHIDTELQIPYSPLYVYELQYADAEDTVKILEQVTKFGQASVDATLKNAAQFGGVRSGDKYFQPMSFQAEPTGNRIIIKAEKEDYLKVREIIRQLDIKQPQIAIEVLVVEVTSSDDRQLGVQIRNKRADTPINNLDFQNSGLPLAGGTRAPVVVDPTTGSLVTNLVSLARDQSPGSLLISIGTAATNGVWAIFKVLQANSHSKILSNPFLVATNKYTAQISVGETRRVIASQVVSGDNIEPTFEDKEANLTVKVTPQINSDGIINLVINFELTVFPLPAGNGENPAEATRLSHTITTNANVANGEVLAFGGLLKTNLTENVTKVPVLGDIPLLGWFFKNKTKSRVKDNILVFISPHIIEPNERGGMGHYSQDKVDEAKHMVCDLYPNVERRDPVHRWFFKDHLCEEKCIIDDFVYQESTYPVRVPGIVPKTTTLPVQNVLENNLPDVAEDNLPENNTALQNTALDPVIEDDVLQNNETIIPDNTIQDTIVQDTLENNMLESDMIENNIQTNIPPNNALESNIQDVAPLPQNIKSYVSNIAPKKRKNRKTSLTQFMPSPSRKKQGRVS